MAASDELVIRPEPQVSRWRPLYQWFLALPHLLYTGALGAAALGAAILAAASVVVTGRVPARLLAFQAMALRERARTFSYVWLLRSSHPPFATMATFEDPGDDDLITVSFPPPAATAGRLVPLGRTLLLVPQGLVLLVIGAVMDLTYPLWALYAAVAGGFPDPIQRALIHVERTVVTFVAYASLLTDTRPRLVQGGVPGDESDQVVVEPVRGSQLS